MMPLARKIWVILSTGFFSGAFVWSLARAIHSDDWLWWAAFTATFGASAVWCICIMQRWVFEEP